MHYNKPNDRSIDETLGAAPNKAFRNRAMIEYRSVSSWTKNDLDLSNAKILDFGCGEGIAAASFALRHPTAVIVGVDVVELSTETLAATLMTQTGLLMPMNMQLMTIENRLIPGQYKFDLTYSWSVFNLIPVASIELVARDIFDRTEENGLFFIQVDPLYFSPSGAILNRYISEPWYHLIFSTSELKNKVLSDISGEREMREWHQYLELNRLTADQIMVLIERTGFRKIRHQIVKASDDPPKFLTDIYKSEALTTRGFQALFKKMR